METIDKVSNALEILYGTNTSSEAKADANKLLLEFQRDESSWELIFTFLDNNDSNLKFELKLFFAQSLKSKIQYDYGQISNNHAAVNNLKFKILKNLNDLDFKNDKLLVVQLAISLTYLMIQDFQWETPVMDTIQSLSNNPLNLLEILKILPEEMNNLNNKLPLNNEEFDLQYEKLLVSNSENVYYILVQSIGMNLNDYDLNILILDCIKSWINEIPPNLVLSTDNNSVLWSLILSGFKDDETFETSINCLISVISKIDIYEPENLQFVEIIYKELVQLNSIITENWEDPMYIERFCELFSIAGELWHTLIIKNPANFQELLEILLRFANYKEDLDIVKYTFKFWYELKSLLVLKNFEAQKNLFKPIFVNLMEVLIGHLKYPTTADTTDLNVLFNNNRENLDKFKDFRYEIGDVLKDCCAIIGAKDALLIPFTKLQGLIENGPLNSNSNSNSNSSRWQDIECLLFSIRSLAKEVDKRESDILPQIMNYLVQLPENPKVRYAATLVLGRYTLWTNEHPEFLQIELNYIIEGFKLDNNSYTANEKMDIIIATSHALKYFCMDCSDLLVELIEPLYNLYLNIENSLDFQSLYDINEGLSYVVQKYNDRYLLANPEQCLNILKMFWNNTLVKLNNEDNADSVADLVELITVFLDNLRPSNEFLASGNKDYVVSNFIMSEVFPVIYSSILKLGKINKVSEKCIKFIRKCIQNFHRFLIHQIKPIENLLIEGFKNFKFGCYLWCSGTLIKEFSNDEGVDENDMYDNELMKEIWGFSVSQIRNFLKLYEDGEINEEIIEDFYRMMGDILMFKPLELFNSFDIVEYIFKISVELLDKINEFDNLNIILNFLTDLLSWSLENPPISVYFELPNILKFKIFEMINGEKGVELLNLLFKLSILKFNEDLIFTNIELIIEVFKINQLYLKNNDSNLKSINNFLNLLPNNLINETEKIKFYTGIETSLNSKNFRKMRSTLLDFIHWYKRKIVNRV